MPRGITQDQVNQAADALIAAGERPTVDKVRVHLGTGSPNTITRMLDTWRQGLAERLREVNQLPSLPDEVGQAMSALWAQAMQHAREHAQIELQTERGALALAKAALETQSAEQAALLTAAQAETAKSAEATRQTTTRADTLQRLVERLETEVKERAGQYAQLAKQVQTSAATETTLRNRIQTMEEKAAEERSNREQYIRTIEDRSHTQVDHARTDLKASRTELTDARKRHQKEIQLLQQQIAELTRSQSAAEREVAHQRGVAEALKLKLSGNAGAKPPGRRGSSKRPSSPRQRRKRK